MSTYLQLGHESWKLLEEPDVGEFAGVVLSPVNDTPEYVTDRLGRLGDRRARLEVVLDPQLYNPAANKGQLATWRYYSAADFSTADHSDERWWADRGRDVAQDAVTVGANAVCSPAMFPRAFTDDYYRLVVNVANETQRSAAERGVETLLTAIVKLSDLANPNRALEIASILTSAECERVYLTFLCDDIEQRAPLKDAATLATAVHLVRLLAAGMRVHVAFCAHDLLLWKLAGAQSISTGKWMNVRRFWPARWQEEEAGGRNVAYWSEDGLLTLIRDQEVMRLDRAGWFATRDFSANPASAQILEILRRQTGEAWLRLSGIQFLRWAVNTENLCQADTRAAANLLTNAHANWGRVLAPAPGGLQMLFVDRFNNGEHVTAWANAYYEGAGR